MLSNARESMYTNRVKKGVINEFFSEIVVVLVRKGSYTTSNIVKDTENQVKERENPKNLVNEKRSSEILAVKMEIFPKKSEILVHEKCFRPPKLGARSPPLKRVEIIMTFAVLS